MKQTSIPGLLFLGLFLACAPRVITEVSLSRSYIELDSLPLSVEVAETIRPYKMRLDKEMKVRIGVAAIELNNSPGIGESVLGNFVADLILEQSNERYDDSVHLSLINAHGGLRAPINRGPVLVENVYEVMPFDNSIYIYSLNAGLARKLFDHCAATKRSVIGGASYEIRSDKAIEIRINNQPIDDNRSYLLAISDYLSTGGGGFGFVAEEGVLLADLQYLQRDMIIDYIKKQTKQGKEITAKIDGRMVITDQ